MSRTSWTCIRWVSYSFSQIKIGWVSADVNVTKFVDFVTRNPDQLSLHFFQFFCDLFHILEVHWYTLENLQKHPWTKKKRNYNRVLRRPSPPWHLASGVLRCRAYRGCHGEARGREGIEEHLPWSTFECLVYGFELVGVDGGSVVRFAGARGEGGLGVGEQGAHEHHVSSWKLLG
jgi:hypothetical protein